MDNYDIIARDQDSVSVTTLHSQTTAGDVAKFRKQFQQRSQYLNICNSIDFDADQLPNYDNKDSIIETRSKKNGHSVDYVNLRPVNLKIYHHV